MNIAIISGLIMLVLFLCLYIAHIKGYRISKPTKKIELPKEEREKAERLQKDFSQVMEYSLSKALERRKA